MATNTNYKRIEMLKFPRKPFALAAIAAGLLSSSIAMGTEKRNVILIIGDGMDSHQITAARNYLVGAQQTLLLDSLPVTATVQVQAVDDRDPSKSVYVADSANSATTLATGVITSPGRIGTSAGDDKDLSTIAEQVKGAGFGAGIVSTASVTDATPASFISHISLRFCENPDMMKEAEALGGIIVDCSDDLKANGGLGSIAEQIADNNWDIVLGGGAKHFESVAEGQQKQTVLEQAQVNAYQIVTSAEGLQTITGDKVLGLFGPSTLPVRWQGTDGRTAEEPSPSILRQIDWRLGSVTLPDTMKCEDNPQYGATPSLKVMTEAALSHLSQKQNRGFFLMIESASIDKESHLRNPCGSIGELQQLEESLQSALSFANDNPNTLIIVTADHGQAAQIIPESSPYNAFGVAVYTPGHIARIETPEGSIMGINYATNDFLMEEHTGTDVSLFANALGRSFFGAHTSQAGIYQAIKGFLLPSQ